MGGGRERERERETLTLVSTLTLPARRRPSVMARMSTLPALVPAALANAALYRSCLTLSNSACNCVRMHVHGESSTGSQESHKVGWDSCGWDAKTLSH